MMLNTAYTPSSSLMAVRRVILALALISGGCGAARQGSGEGKTVRQYRFDENLSLRLDEIISGPSGTLQLHDPVSLDETATGGLVILCQTPPRIIIVDPTWNVINQTGNSGYGYSELDRPRFIRAGFGMNYTVADENGKVLVYDTQLRILNTFEPVYEASGFPHGRPSGVAISLFGDTFFADKDNDIVYEFGPSGKFVKTLGGAEAGAGRLTRPEGLAVAKDGSVVVCDSDAGRVVVFDRDGTYLDAIGDGDLGTPGCVAITPDDQAVFIGDRRTGRLDLYSLSGDYLVSWERAELNFQGTGGIADLLATDSHLYVVGQDGGQILKFRFVPGDKE